MQISSLPAAAENMSLAPYAHDEGPLRLPHGQRSELVDTMVNDALWDAFNDYHMGITAENICEQWGLTREELDKFASSQPAEVRGCSHRRQAHFKDEIVPVEVKNKENHRPCRYGRGPAEPAPTLRGILASSARRSRKTAW